MAATCGLRHTSSHFTQPIDVTMTDILQEQDGAILRLRINRPKSKNALTHAMYTALTDGLKQAADDKSTRVVLIQGVDGCFCAGNDMNDFLEHPPENHDSPVMQFLATLMAFPKPVVAAVEGPAVGIGTTMLLHCDLVYVAPDAKLKLPFVSLGVCPEAGSSMILPALMGHQRAAELLLLGDTISGEKAAAIGLVNRASEQCIADAEKAAQRLASLPPSAIRLTKQLMKTVPQDPLQQQMRLEGDHFFQRLSSPEAREAMQAFVEKRAPDFSQFD